MNKEAQQIAIAEACGWRFTQGAHGLMWHDVLKIGRIAPGTEVHEARVRMQLPTEGAMIPDSLTDLNAMHEAMKVLTNDERKSFIVHLITVVRPTARRESPTDWENGWYEINATAAQRAEAFLKTIGK